MQLSIPHAVRLLLFTILSFMSAVSFSAPTYCPQNLSSAQLELPLTIGTKFSPPFVMGAKDNLEGLSIILWELIASCLDLQADDYKYLEFGTTDELIAATAAGDLDLAIAAISVTAQREAVIDFSHHYFQASLGTLVADRETAANFGVVLKRIRQSNIPKIIFGLLSFMVIIAISYWWSERKSGNEFFATGPLKGFYRALIWATLLVFQGRGDPFSLNTRLGQLLVLFLMFFGVTIVSSFTAIITSSLTLQALEPEIKTLEDLTSKTVAAKALGFAASWAADANVLDTTVQTFPQVQRKFDEGDIDVFIHDREILQYLVTTHALVDVKLAPLTMAPQDYAIALPNYSPLREDLNQSILTILADPIWQTYLTKNLGSQ